MSKLRKKFIAVLAVLFCVLLTLSAALMIPKNKTAEASSTDNGLNVGNLIKSGTGTNIIIDRTNLATLYARLTGNSSATFSNVEGLVAGDATLNGQQIREKASGATATESNTVGEFTVNVGGMEWIPTYLSKTKVGDVILTLWLADSSIVYSSTGTTNGTGVKFYTWNDFETTNEEVIAHPEYISAGMYDTSKVRSYLVGSQYASGKNKSAPDAKLQPNSILNGFTTNYGNLIETPKTVEWQEKQSAKLLRKSRLNNDITYYFVGDSWGVPTGYTTNNEESQWANKADMYIYKNNYYGAWQDDKIWLPSKTEVGDLSKWNGFWNLSANQLKNSNYAYFCRSGCTNSTSCVTNDHNANQQVISTLADKSNNKYLSVRPAFHLNLTKAEYTLLVPKDVENTYTGSEQKLADLTNKPDWYTEYTTAYSSSSNVEVEYPTNDGDMIDATDDGYVVKVTIPSGSNYRWADGADKSTPKTFKFKIKKKELKVTFLNKSGTKFNTANPVTSGDADNYPIAAFPQEVKDVGIYDHDKPEGGDNPNPLFPKLKIKYTNAAGNDNAYNDYKIPTLPGKYRATAEMENDCNYCLAEDDPSQGYYSYREFTIEKIKVAVPSLALGEGETVSSINNFVYDGKAHTVKIPIFDNALDATQIFGDITAYSDLVTITATDATTLSYNETTHTAAATNANTYTLTARLKNAGTMEWVGGGSEPLTLTFTIKKAQLRLDFADGDPDDGADFDKGEWARNPSGSVKFVVNVDGEIGSEQVVLKVYYTEKDGGDETVLNDQGGRTYSIRGDLEKGDYKLYAELVPSVATNANYEIAISGSVVSKIDKAFKVTSAQVGFKPDALVWQYTNGDTTQDIASGDHVTYNGNAYTISLKTTDAELEALGVKKESAPSGDVSKENSNAHPDEGEVYIITVKIVALTADYEYEGEEITFKWYIDQADYDLSKYTPVWSYTTARGETGLYSKAVSDYGGVQYEGGGTLGNITLSITGGLPTGLTANLTGNVQSAVNKYTVKVKSFTNTNKNYNDIKSLPSVSDVEWIEWEWEIVPRTLSTSDWSAAVYNDGKVTKAPELNTLPYNPSLEYKYYKTKGGEEIPLSELKYKDGVPETYYVEVFIQSSDSGNWKLGSEDNPHEFKVGQQKDAVVITITAGGTYDGNPKEATIGLVGQYAEIDEDSFDIKYFKADDTPLSGAPTDAGSYYAVVSLKTRFAENYYLNCDDRLNFEIKTLELAIPSYSGTIVYDGEEHDVAKLVNLPDGWENYLTISIESKTSGVDHPKGYTVKTAATYTVTYRIKAEVNENLAINSPKNVQWVGGTITSKSIENLVVEQLILHAEEWEKAGYNSYLVFTEPGGQRFVEYTVTNSDGEIIVDEDGVVAGETYTVKVTVKDEHLGSVVIEYPKGVTDRYEFFKDDGTPPVQVALPTIGDLTFNGKSQTFTVDYGKFAEYIEIEEALSDLLAQRNVDQYTVYFKIKRGMNAVWATTGDRNAVPVTFEMKPLILEDPKVKDGEKFTYNGTEQSATLNIDSAMEFMIIEGDYKATNADKYTFTLSIDPSYEGNVVWASAEASKTVEWEIEKAKISVKWTDGEVPELDLPEEFKDLGVDYEIRDENGNVVARDQMEAGGKYTITAKLKDGSSANYEFVDDNGKPLATPTKTDGMSFQYKSAESPFPWWIIALIAGVLLLLAVLIIIIVKRRQVADGDDEYDDYYDDEYDFDEEIEEDDDFGDDIDF